MMKAHALTLSLLLVIGCSTTTTTTVVEEEIEETKSSADRAEKTPKKAPLQVTEEMQNPSPSPKSNDDSKCALKSSREDCRECCQVIGEGHCLAMCDEKPAANDCRNNGCPGDGESCKYCWTRYVCLKAGTIC
jgi:hypothetical protein